MNRKIRMLSQELNDDVIAAKTRLQLRIEVYPALLALQPTLHDLVVKPMKDARLGIVKTIGAKLMASASHLAEDIHLQGRERRVTRDFQPSAAVVDSGMSAIRAGIARYFKTSHRNIAAINGLLGGAFPIQVGGCNRILQIVTDLTGCTLAILLQLRTYRIPMIHGRSCPYSVVSFLLLF